MKKLLIIATMAGVTGLTAFAQGNFIGSAGARYVWDNYSGANPVNNANQNVGFLWQSGSGAPLIASFGASTPTNNLATHAIEGSPANWAAILNDPNWTVATTATGVAVGTTSSVGGVSMNGGSPIGILGTSAGGGTVNVFYIAWDKAYATPLLASQNNSPLGWSRPFAYNYASNVGTPASSMGATASTLDANLYKFGVTPTVAVPEPATLALAGLCISAMLVSRRRK